MKLRFGSEGRKIICAHKDFAALGLDYKPTTGRTFDLWETWEVAATIRAGTT